jgi:iron complex transport system permease protein
MTRSALPGLIVGIAVLLAGLVLAFLVGRYPVSLGEVLDLLWSRASGDATSVQPAVESVVLQVRGPRVLAAVFVGAALAVAGTAFQGLFRNPPGRRFDAA